MRFSILIPVVKTSYFEAALNSAENQSFNDYEIVILDNKADAPLDHYAARPKVRYIKNEEQLPPAENWNKGLQLCNGDYVLVLCDDDLLKQNTLSELDAFFSTNPELEVVRFLREETHNNYVARFSCPGGTIETIDAFVYYQETFLRGNALSDMAFSRTAALEIGGFRPLPEGWGCDRLLALEIAARKNKIGNLNKVLLTYRFNPKSLTANTKNIIGKMEGDELYFQHAKRILENAPGTYQKLALIANHKRLQSQQDGHYIITFINLNFRLFRTLWKKTKNSNTSRWRSIFVALNYATQKWIGKKCRTNIFRD